jgi:drug/metabolite transporter (DMT)-like permease
VHFFPEKAAIPVGWDWLWLLLLGVLCTNVAYIFSMNALKTVSAYESALAINLEPVYGIAMAYFLFKDEQLDGQFYVGTAIILLSVVGHQAWKMWRK